MHDTAVGTANFTECVPAPTDEGSRSQGDRGTVDTEPTDGLQRRPQSSAVGFHGIRTSERSPDAEPPVVRAGLLYDSFQQLSLGDSQDARKL